MDQPKDNEKVRLNLEISAAAHQRALMLRDRTKAASITEVIRRSLSLMELLTKHAAIKGNQIVFRHPDGREEIVRFLF